MSEKAGFSLAQDLLERCHKRAAKYDKENCFFQDDFDELKEAGYLLMTVPTELGGGGATITELCQAIRELAHHFPSTALAFSMHSHLVAASVWNFRNGRPGEKLLRHRITVVMGQNVDRGNADLGEQSLVKGGLIMETVVVVSRLVGKAEADHVRCDHVEMPPEILP